MLGRAGLVILGIGLTLLLLEGVLRLGRPRPRSLSTTPVSVIGRTPSILDMTRGGGATTWRSTGPRSSHSVIPKHTASMLRVNLRGHSKLASSSA